MVKWLAIVTLSCCAPLALAAEPSGKADLAKGQTTAAQVCAPCHGADGNSPSPSNPILAGQIPEYLQKQMANFKGASGKRAERDNPVMAAMVANLTAEEMHDVAAYFASQKPRPGVAKSRDTLTLGQKIFRGGDATKGLPACAGCHGPAGGGIPSQFPRLAGQYPEYTQLQLKSFHDGTRGNDANKVMRAVAARMTEREIQAVSDYIAGIH